jgi:hypothetical protein
MISGSAINVLAGAHRLTLRGSRYADRSVCVSHFHLPKQGRRFFFGLQAGVSTAKNP